MSSNSQAVFPQEDILARNAIMHAASWRTRPTLHPETHRPGTGRMRVLSHAKLTLCYNSPVAQSGAPRTIRLWPQHTKTLDKRGTRRKSPATTCAGVLDLRSGTPQLGKVFNQLGKFIWSQE